MTELILSQLGATPEQIERERERARSKLFGGSLPLDSFVSTQNVSAGNTEPDGKDDPLSKP